MARAAMKFAATAPQVLGSAAILTVVGPLVPTWAGTGLGVIILGVLVLATGVGEPTAARLLRGARPMSAVQQHCSRRRSLNSPHPGFGRQASVFVSWGEHPLPRTASTLARCNGRGPRRSRRPSGHGSQTPTTSNLWTPPRARSKDDSTSRGASARAPRHSASAMVGTSSNSTGTPTPPTRSKHLTSCAPASTPKAHIPRSEPGHFESVIPPRSVLRICRESVDAGWPTSDVWRCRCAGRYLTRWRSERSATVDLGRRRCDAATLRWRAHPVRSGRGRGRPSARAGPTSGNVRTARTSGGRRRGTAARPGRPAGAG